MFSKKKTLFCFKLKKSYLIQMGSLWIDIVEQFYYFLASFYCFIRSVISVLLICKKKNEITSELDLGGLTYPLNVYAVKILNNVFIASLNAIISKHAEANHTVFKITKKIMSISISTHYFVAYKRAKSLLITAVA